MTGKWRNSVFPVAKFGAKICGECFVLVLRIFWKKGKDPHPQDKIQHLDFTKDPRPLYYKAPSCVLYHKNVWSKAVFGP